MNQIFVFLMQFELFYYYPVYVYFVYMHMCMTCVLCVYGDPKRASEHIELELQMADGNKSPCGCLDPLQEQKM